MTTKELIARVEGALFFARETAGDWLTTQSERLKDFSYRVRRKREEVEDKPEREPVDDGPFNCPKCSARIELRGDEYFCVGLRNREEVEYYLAREYPKGIAPNSIRAKEPCTWKAKASEYGKSWR